MNLIQYIVKFGNGFTKHLYFKKIDGKEEQIEFKEFFDTLIATTGFQHNFYAASAYSTFSITKEKYDEINSTLKGATKNTHQDGN